MPTDDDHLVVAFKMHSQKNEAKSREAGRPIYEDMEVCTIRTPGDKLAGTRVYPAHAFQRWIINPETGNQEQQTYAMRFNRQYLRFKEGRQQIQEGTPIDELPFLTQAKRMELKALSIYTAETLAALDGQPLKTLGPGGRELKDQAQAFIDKASGTADAVRMAAEIAALKARLAEVENDRAPVVVEPSRFDAMDDEALKEFIKEQTGARPRGNPSRETLVRMAAEAGKQAA